MATKSGRTSPAVIDFLFSEPYRFDFFQAVRVLEAHSRERSHSASNDRREAVGRDDAPRSECVRFRSAPSLSFAPATLRSIASAPENGSGKEDETSRIPPPPQMVVSFMGLFGPEGVLPNHYSRLLINRVIDKDFALRDYWDLFNHRTISLFYRAWRKYHFSVEYERTRVEPGGREIDLFTDCLYCLTGLGTGNLRGRLEVADETFLYYAGSFAHYPRSAVTLEFILADYFELPITVLQLQGQWLYLDDADRSQMPTDEHRDGRNNRLGVSFVVGKRVWDAQSKFRIRLGPLSLEQFRSFLPGGSGLTPLSQLTRQFVGPEFDFDVQPVLRGEDVPGFRLKTGAADGPRLGWTTWSCRVKDSKRPDSSSFFQNPVDDVVVPATA